MVGRLPKDGYEKVDVIGRVGLGEEKDFFKLFDMNHTCILINFGKIMCDALARAVHLRRQPYTPDEALKIAAEEFKDRDV
jgi:hypothetical protein